MTYTRADPYIVAGGNKGSYGDEQGLTRTWDSARAASIQWQTTTKRSGVGAWHFTGGNQSSECSLMTSEATYPMAMAEGWSQMAIRFAAWSTNAGRKWIMVCVVQGDSGLQASDKAVATVDETGMLWLTDTNNSANDVQCTQLSLNTWYTVLIHPKGGTSGSLLQELYCYNGTTGALIASCSNSWAVGNTGSNDVTKWGCGSSMNTTSMDYYFEDLIVWKGLATNPGPCKVYTLRPASVVGAGNWTATGAADIPAAVTENNGGNRTVTDGATTNADPTFDSATGAFDAGLDINAELIGSGITGGRLVASVSSSTSVEMTGNASATASGVTVTIQRRGHNGDTSYATVNNATASNAELALDDASVPSGDDIHTVISNLVQRHTGSSPTIQAGVNSGGTVQTYVLFPTSNTNWAVRRAANGGAATSASHPTDPATGTRWTTAAVDAMTGIMRDADALAREIRVTNAAWDVVAAMNAGGTTHTAAVALTGTGTLTTAATRKQLATVALTGAGTLATAAVRTARGTAALTGAGTLTTGAVRTARAVVAMTGTGTLFAQASGIGTLIAAATLTGTGTLTTAAVRTARAAVAFTGSGTFTVVVPAQFVTIGSTATWRPHLTATWKEPR